MTAFAPEFHLFRLRDTLLDIFPSVGTGSVPDVPFGSVSVGFRLTPRRAVFTVPGFCCPPTPLCPIKGKEPDETGSVLGSILGSTLGLLAPLSTSPSRSDLSGLSSDSSIFFVGGGRTFFGGFFEPFFEVGGGGSI